MLHGDPTVQLRNIGQILLIIDSPENTFQCQDRSSECGFRHEEVMFSSKCS